MNCRIAVASAISTFVLTSVPAVAADPVVTCEGRPATLVGDPSVSHIFGTDGDDVVVTGGSQFTETREGHDLICVTGSGASSFVDAGPGDDDVISDDTAGAWTGITLGSGDDSLTGGARNDGVSGGPGADQISTGEGRDGVGSETGPDGPESSGDTIDLGPGDDVAYGSFELMAAPLDGGEGVNHLILWDGHNSGTRTMRVDNRAERVTADGSLWFAWNDFTIFEFEVSSRIHFTGSAAGESVTSYQSEGVGPRLGGRWNLGGGSDEVEFTNFAGHVRGGAGLDRLSVRRYISSDVPVDPLGMRVRLGLGRGHLRFDEVQQDYSVSGIENGSVEGFRYSFLRGDERANELRVTPDCRAWVFGGKGDDVVTSANAPDCASSLPAPTSFRGVRAYGGPGDDVLTGGRAPDTLVGDQGTDRVDGRRGKDACVAEVTRHCERTAP